MFDLARFRKLIAATWLENRRAWAWFLGSCVLLHLAVCIVMFSTEDGWKGFSNTGQSGMWFFGLFLTAPIFAARYFTSMGRREAALVMLLRPASAFEKWLLAVLAVAVLYPVAYTVVFQICNFPAWLLAEAIHAAREATGEGCQCGDHAAGAHDYFVPWKLLDEPKAWLTLCYGFLGTFQAFAMLGSLYFRSFPIIKTALAAFLIMLLLMFANAVGGGEPSLFFGYWEGRNELLAWQRLFFPVAWLLIPALLWIASLLALREREVA